MSGRVGDSPSVGHGNFADNYSGAVSGTGSGEYFMRAGVARRIARRLEDDNISAQVIFPQLPCSYEMLRNRNQKEPVCNTVILSSLDVDAPISKPLLVIVILY
jgi:hypothetical protein